MSAIFQIAWREYKQYVLSRGFLLFLVMFPLGIIFGTGAIGLIENSRPLRNFVVFDEAGIYAEIIDSEIDERRRWSILGAWDTYLEIAIDPEKIDIEDLPKPFAPARRSSKRLAAFEEAGGVEAGQKVIEPYLRSPMIPFAFPKRQFNRLELPADIAAASSLEEAADLLRPYLLDEAAFPGAGKDGLFAAVLIPEGFSADEDGPEAQFWSQNVTDPALEASIRRSLTAALQRDVAGSLGLSPEQLDAVADADANVIPYHPEELGENAELDREDRVRTAVLPAAMTYMLLVIIFGVGNLLLTNTIEERSNKIVEVLLSSVTANQLMLGKLIGIAAVGLTMPTALVLGGLFLSFTGGGNDLVNDTMGALLTSNLIPIYLFYFFCAYAIFAMIFLAIGAISNSLQDAQSYMGPVMILLFAPLPFMILAFQDPNGLAATILTWIPIYTPYAVMLRAASDPPLWEIIGATALMLAFAIMFARVMGRIFRSAILESAPPKAKDIWKLAKKPTD